MTAIKVASTATAIITSRTNSTMKMSRQFFRVREAMHMPVACTYGFRTLPQPIGALVSAFDRRRRGFDGATGERSGHAREHGCEQQQGGGSYARRARASTNRVPLAAQQMHALWRGSARIVCRCREGSENA